MRACRGAHRPAKIRVHRRETLRADRCVQGDLRSMFVNGAIPTESGPFPLFAVIRSLCVHGTILDSVRVRTGCWPRKFGCAWPAAALDPAWRFGCLAPALHRTSPCFMCGVRTQVVLQQFPSASDVRPALPTAHGRVQPQYRATKGTDAPSTVCAIARAQCSDRVAQLCTGTEHAREHTPCMMHVVLDCTDYRACCGLCCAM